MRPDEIKYCLLSFDYQEEAECRHWGESLLPISGLFNWARVFGGKRCFPRSPEDFSQFNLFHINLTTKNLCLVPSIIKRLPAGAKLLINIDFAIELWNTTFTYPDLLLDIIDRADYLFAVEPTMALMLTDALNRDVACIPHPSDIDGLSKLGTNERVNQILVNLHRYDANFLLPHFALRDLPDGFQTVAAGSTQQKQSLLHLYDFIHDTSQFHNFMELLSTMYMAFETYTMHSYGRFSVECAALGIPCVGPDIVYSMRQCFPFTIAPVNDVPAMRQHVLRLIADKPFYVDTALYAIEAAGQFSFNACRKRMLEHISVERR